MARNRIASLPTGSAGSELGPCGQGCNGYNFAYCQILPIPRGYHSGPLEPVLRFRSRKNLAAKGSGREASDC
jgi:hypothetical protein